MSKEKLNPSPTLPFSGEGADIAPTNLRGEVLAQAPRQGVVPSPCKGGGREGVKIFNRPQKTSLRRELRKNPTEPERKLWGRIRNRQLGVKFRRQHGIGHYIVDFYLAEPALVIELDGDSHYTETGIEHDRVRNGFLNALGISILRFTNLDVMHNCDGVLTTIQSHIENLQKQSRSEFDHVQ